MTSMKNLFLILMISASVPLFSQEKQTMMQYKMIKDIKGDLNKDGLEDKILLSAHPTDAKQPLKIQIFFLGSDRKFKSVFTSTDIFETAHSSDQKYTTPDIKIENNNLIIATNTHDVKLEQTFRFNKTKFELIAVHKIQGDETDNRIETKIDLLNATLIEIKKPAGAKKPKKTQKTISVNALPTLDNIKSFDHEFQ